MEVNSRRALAIGASVIDYIGLVEKYPKVDDKIRALSCETVLGGNCLNASVVLARLGISIQLTGKLGEDSLAKQILTSLKNEGVDVSLFLEKKGATSSFTYVIVDMETKSRTCINNPCEDLLPNDLANMKIPPVPLLLIDGKHTQFVAELLKSSWMECNPKILLDAETERMNREGFGVLVEKSQYIKCGQSFPTAFTGKKDILEAMVSLRHLNKIEKKWILTTLGSLGSIILVSKDSYSQLHCKLDEKSFISIEDMNHLTKLISSTTERDHLVGFYYAEHTVIHCKPFIPKEQIINTTGAGDVYFGSLGYSILCDHSVEQMMSLASYISSMKCTKSGVEAIPNKEDLKKQFSWFGN